MVNYKKVGLRIFFTAEVLIFVAVYLVGPEGLQGLTKKKKENKELAYKAVALSQNIKKLEAEIQKWEHNHFYQEKVAREQLQMARPTDEVYYTTEK